MPPFLARDTDDGRLPAAAAQIQAQAAAPPGSVAINMANLGPSANDESANKAKVETLFGPPVGIGGTAAPEWTVLAGRDEINQDKEEELTMDIVQEWVKRSKEEVDDKHFPQ